VNASLPTKMWCTHLVRSHVTAHLYDESGTAAWGTAIYCLSDPRDIRAVRYVGQTKDPKRRFLQHLNTARLWVPDETPWWVKSPKLRPLSEWIRALYQDEYRLPTMVIAEWVVKDSDARLAERNRICSCLRDQLRLLNVESRLIGKQMLLV